MSAALAVAAFALPASAQNYPSRPVTLIVPWGAGGGTDATNTLDPLVSVITSVSYDHVQTLGPTLTDIARHKSGIMRPGRPVISAPQMPEAAREIERFARERQQ